MEASRSEDLNEDDSAADEVLRLGTMIDVKPLSDNPMAVSVKLSGKGNNIKREYVSGEGRIKVVGDPYAVFDDKRQ